MLVWESQLVQKQRVRWTANTSRAGQKSRFLSKNSLVSILPCLVDRTSASSKHKGTGFNQEGVNMLQFKT